MVVCVGAIVLDGDRVLLVRQSQGHDLEGQWTVPWGRVDEGESPASAALREVREEGGVRAEVGGLLGYQELDREGWMALAFLCRHVDGQPRPDGRETDRARYFSSEEIESLAEPVEPWSRWIVGRVLAGTHSAIPAVPDNPFAPEVAYL